MFYPRVCDVDVACRKSRRIAGATAERYKTEIKRSHPLAAQRLPRVSYTLRRDNVVDDTSGVFVQ